MSAIWSRIMDEPVLLVTLVQTIIILAVTLGLKVSPEQTAAIIAVTGAVLAIVARQNVSPT